MQDLERLATIAHAQGRGTVEAVCRAALARIGDLERELAAAIAARDEDRAERRHRNNAGQGARTRMIRLTPAQRSMIALKAAQQRWKKSAPPDATDAHG